MMSVTLNNEFNAGRVRCPRDPSRARLFSWLVSAVVIPPLIWQFAEGWGDYQHDLWLMTALAVVVAVADLLPVPHWTTYTLSVSTPVTIAAGVLLGPVQAGVIAFLAAFDTREFTGQVPLSRAVFNRSQIAASVYLASLVFHLFGRGPTELPLVLIPLLLAVLVDFAVNAFSSINIAHLVTGLDRKRIIANVYGESQIRHVATYGCLGLLALLIAAEVEVAGPWGVVVFAAPLLLARELFANGQRLRDAAHQLRGKNIALLETMQRMAAERRDERLALAGGLHDELLPPLFKVHLMGQVLRQDLASGRLLELDDDVPDLVSATDEVQEKARSILGGLTRSSLGPDGLNSALQLLVRTLESEGAARIRLDLEDVGGSDVTQLLAYQVAREAMTNASHHARASSITVTLSKGKDRRILLTVEDDGVGFDVNAIVPGNHVGLHLMRERALSAGGALSIDSEPGAGTRVRAVLPPDLPGA
jgi:signal transduction histidine kinase